MWFGGIVERFKEKRAAAAVGGVNHEGVTHGGMIGEHSDQHHDHHALPTMTHGHQRVSNVPLMDFVTAICVEGGGGEARVSFCK